MRLLVLLYILFNYCTCLAQVPDPQQVTIVRDEWGIPHIFADSDANAAYGLAYAMAEDKFDLLQDAFITAKGLVGVQKGIKGAAVDYVLQFLGIPQTVKSHYEADISTSFKRVLEGYCAGLNAYANHHRRQVKVKQVFPVTPYDVITYSILQMAVLSGAKKVLKNLNGGKVEQLDEMSPAGSNAFAFNQNITNDGSTYLVINPHQQLDGLISWYEAHISTNEGWNFTGALLPGSPIPLLGANTHLGWTHTVNNPDLIDVYQLQLQQEDSKHYILDNQVMLLDEEKARLKIRILFFNINIKRSILHSVIGPTIVNKKGAYAIRMPALFDIRALEQWYRMSKATSFKTFKAALAMQAIPVYNIMYADKEGNIFFVANARLPIRDPHFDYSGILPGNTSKAIWTTFYPIDSLPQAANPSSGYLYNCNHSVYNATEDAAYHPLVHYDSTMGFKKDENNRSERFRERIAAYKKISYANIRSIKYDRQYPETFRFEENINEFLKVPADDYPDISDVINMFKNWDRKADTISCGATLLCVMLYRMTDGYYFKPEYKPITHKQAVEVYRYARAYLINHFGRINVPLGEYQRLVRGNKNFAVPGGPDLLANIESKPLKNGKVKAYRGDCYIAFVGFNKDTITMETVTNYGATNRQCCVHYTDQMELFLHDSTKKMSFDKHEILQRAHAIYHPQ